jgi:F-type H+-transporting ATPase subunit alpha
MNSVPLNKVRAFEKEFLNQLDSRFEETLVSLGGKKVTDEAKKTLTELAEEVSLNYQD